MRFRNLKLQHQLILMVGITMLCIFSGIFLVTQFFIEQLTTDIQDKTFADVNLAVENVVISNAQRLSNISKSHSYWTELVEATNQNNQYWIDENATRYLVEDPSYGVELIYLKNSVNGYAQLLGDLPEEVYTQMYAHLTEDTLETNIVSFFISYREKHYLVSITPLMDTGSVKTFGFMAMGQRLDGDIEKVIMNQFKNIAEVSVEYKPTKDLLITHFHMDEIEKYLDQHLTIHVTDIQMTKMIHERSQSVLTAIFTLFAISMLILLFTLLRVSRNFKSSIDQIKSISYNDYSKKINLTFSKDFQELGECINSLSEQLGRRDQEINRKYVEMISILVKTLEEVDIYTKGHSERVSHYSVELAKAVSYQDVETIKLSGLLHDVGKVTVDINILNKPTSLTPEEFEEIKKHPGTGYNILAMSNIFSPIKDIVKYHHERFDGTGYPEGLKGDEIPIGARIVALADVFDSLTSTRSYRDSMSIEDALKIITDSAGTHFDPELTHIFLEMAEQTYHTWSRLNTTPNLNELIIEAERVMNEHETSVE